MPVTTLSIKLKFPEFVTFDDTAIQFALDEAVLEVADDTDAAWANLAIEYKTAAFLMRAKSAAENDGKEIASETFGRISLTYVQSAVSKTAGGSEVQNIYETRFDEIMTKNFPTGIMTV